MFSMPSPFAHADPFQVAISIATSTVDIWQRGWFSIGFSWLLAIYK